MARCKRKLTDISSNNTTSLTHFFLCLVFPTGHSGLDFTPPSWERTLDPKTPIIVVLHGLSGGDSINIRLRSLRHVTRILRIVRELHPRYSKYRMCTERVRWAGVQSLRNEFPWMCVAFLYISFRPFIDPTHDLLLSGPNG